MKPDLTFPEYKAKSGRIKIIITDHDKTSREKISSILSLHPDFEVIAEGSDLSRTIKEAFRLGPNLVLLDLDVNNQNEIKTLHKIRNKFPGVKLLVISDHLKDEYILGAFEAGASGYLLKKVAVEELAKAIRAVHNDQYYLCPSISKSVIEACLRKTKI
jgi:two-component system response regulator DegU